jgi:hypothetical protein
MSESKKDNAMEEDPGGGIELTDFKSSGPLLQQHTLPELDLFLWVLHGINVASNHNFYPVETKFEALTFYSKPFESAEVPFLKSLLNPSNTSCSLVTGSCPIVPIVDKRKNKKYAFLPPLFFEVREIDSRTPLERDHPLGPRFSTAFGLYHIKLSRSGKDNCVIKQNNQILDFNTLLASFGDSRPQSYSTLFKKVYDHCGIIGLDPETCMLGLYVCQSSSFEYAKEYDLTNVRGLIPRHIDTDLNPAPTFDSIPTNTNDYKVYILSLPMVTPIDINWKPLAKMTSQGCALNVLSYYRIMHQTRAREEVTCLSLKGTSIFRIMDYVYNYYSQPGLKPSYSFLTEEPYLILRYQINIGIQQIFNYIHAQTTNPLIPIPNQFFIFKLYRQFYQAKTTKLSQIGHTVSIAVYKAKMHYIDPQSGIVSLIGERFDINSLYPGMEPDKRFKYVDIIFARYKTTSVTFPSIQYDPAEIINVRVPGITYGGKIKTKKHRRSKNKSKSKKNKSKSYKVKGKRSKLDPFEQMMRETDRANHVKSVLIIDDKV